MKLKSIVGSIVLGFLISLATGLLSNDSGISIPELKRYGHPFVWLVTNLNGSTEYILINLAADVVIWTVASLFTLFLLFKAVPARARNSSSTTPYLVQETVPRQRSSYIFLLYYLFFAFVMKAVSEFVHEILGHGFFAMLFGGTIVSLTISLLWPYRLSCIGIHGIFEAWQRPWIAGAGILVCLIVSCSIQALLTWKVKAWRLTVPLFWLAFWTFVNPAGYLIIGGIKPFGDISQLIADGVLSQPLSVAIGVIVFASNFFSLSTIFMNIIQTTGFVMNKKTAPVFLGLLWLTIPFITLMAIIGLGFLSSYSPLLTAISFLPSIVVFFLPVDSLSAVKRHFS
ncbi:MAG: hypothetical protein JSV20_06815 [Candidatus Bathyarchaeota archaeon]|nr:MAG: hypothetical protein JSV20_06815 [Candidatus Bathyarchaeota archaeon]